ncbi:hypothetical protein C8R45DRAFT_929069 [Mycena sanguinolenta]|nr:hypothetical protein C8R45DRAFT_929069 [Mycena sanguinolenta]
MAPGGQACDWTSDPNDKIVLIAHFKTIKDKIGQGGSWDQTCLESAAAHLVSRGPPVKGAPKNANSVKGVWGGMKKIHNRYPGASGWTYNQQAGFSICDNNRAECKEFAKQHPVFKLFANKGWEFFDDVKDILPTRARGMRVFNPAVAAISQPLTDWSQTQSGFSQPAGGLTQPVTLAPTNTPIPAAPGLARAPVPVTPSNGVMPVVLAALGTPSGVKHAASDEFQTLWTTKKGKTTGPDALLALGGSVDRVGNAIHDCFMPQKSSAVSPTKQVEHTRQLTVDDQEAGTLMSRERAILNLIFTRDTKAADTLDLQATGKVVQCIWIAKPAVKVSFIVLQYEVVQCNKCGWDFGLSAADGEQLIWVPSIAKVRPPLGILADLLSGEVTHCWKAHITCVKFGRGENVKDLSKVAASTKLACFNIEQADPQTEILWYESVGIAQQHGLWPAQ